VSRHGLQLSLHEFGCGCASEVVSAKVFILSFVLLVAKDWNHQIKLCHTVGKNMGFLGAQSKV
jgi:hypothetical protein